MKPLTPRNLWNHETIDTMRPMKPWLHDTIIIWHRHWHILISINSCTVTPSCNPSNHLHFEPDRDSASPTPSESSNRSDDRNKRSSWSLTEERCLIAAFKEYYDRLKSTKSSQAKKKHMERYFEAVSKYVLWQWRGIWKIISAVKGEVAGALG